MTHHTWLVLLVIAEVLFFAGVAASVLRIFWRRRKAASFDEWDKYDNLVKDFYNKLLTIVVIIAIFFAALWLNKHGSDVLKWTVSKLGSGTVQYFVIVAVVVSGLLAHF